LVAKLFYVRPIGVVRSPVKEPAKRDWSQVVSEILVEPRWAEHLEGLEEFSHIYVIYILHLIRGRSPAKVHPWGMKDLPLVGVFATRSPVRPNRLGLRLVELLERRGTTLVVKGLDAVDGTPVIDLKPYTGRYDVAENVRVPEWVRRRAP
jgi:tRNA-Thr(GGU) m(6)t(6)A37 methyltransferase TsaA